jgi:Aspartyl protease
VRIFQQKASGFARNISNNKDWHTGCITTVVRSCLCGILFFVAALFQVRANSTVLSEFPFEFREGLLWVQVSVPQSRKPLNFLLDTGAGASVLNLNTAKQIGLKLGEAIPVRGVQTTLTGYWLDQMSAKAGDVQLPHDYLAVDLEKLGKACERPVDGLIGMNFFRGNVVQIDFDAQKIRILKPEKAKKSDEVLPLELRPCGMRVPITVDGHKRQWVRLDTGCASALQWVTSAVRPEQCTRQTAIGLIAISIPQTTTTVGIGKHQFEDVPTGLHETAIFPGEAGLLGSGLISRFSTVTIDAKAGRVILKERHSTQ